MNRSDIETMKHTIADLRKDAEYAEKRGQMKRSRMLEKRREVAQRLFDERAKGCRKCAYEGTNDPGMCPGCNQMERANLYTRKYV